MNIKSVRNEAIPILREHVNGLVDRANANAVSLGVLVADVVESESIGVITDGLRDVRLDGSEDR